MDRIVPREDRQGRVHLLRRFRWHIDDPKVKRTLASLEEHCEQLSVSRIVPRGDS